MRRIVLVSVLLLAGACGGEAPVAETADKPTAETGKSQSPEAEPADEKPSQPFAPAEPVDALRLYVMDCGRITMNDLSLFAAHGEYDGRTNKAADMCYLVRHPDGDMIWDTGLPDVMAQNENGEESGPFFLEVPKTLQSQLWEIGVLPKDVEFLALSHSHFDHVGNTRYFRKATFLINSKERDYMFREEARKQPQNFSLVSALQGAETITFDGDYDVFGDGTVKILATPGHTPGHSSLFVDLPNTGPVLLTGDLYHLIESRERRIYPSFNTNGEETLASMDKFEALAEETGARVIIQHALEHMNELPLAPAYLD